VPCCVAAGKNGANSPAFSETVRSGNFRAGGSRSGALARGKESSTVRNLISASTRMPPHYASRCPGPILHRRSYCRRDIGCGRSCLNWVIHRLFLMAQISGAFSMLADPLYIKPPCVRAQPAGTMHLATWSRVRGSGGRRAGAIASNPLSLKFRQSLISAPASYPGISCEHEPFCLLQPTVIAPLPRTRNAFSDQQPPGCLGVDNRPVGCDWIDYMSISPAYARRLCLAGAFQAVARDRWRA